MVFALLALLAWPFAPVERTVLGNGLTVLVAPDRSSPLVSVGVMYTVGARNETAGITGLAHYVEHMNFRATKRFPGTEITEAITRIGGRWNGYTWIDQTYYAETVYAEALDRMLDLERDRMADALYDPGDFSKERTSVIAELHSYGDPRSVLYDAVLAASFEIHPYRHNTIGWLTDVENVTRDDAYAFYRRFYHPDNAVLVIVGDVEPAAALAKVRARFASLPAGGEPTRVRTVEPPQAGERRVTVRRPGPHARVLAAFRAPALAEPDFPALVMLDALIAGGKGFRFTRDYPEDASAPLHRAVTALSPEASADSQWQAARDPYVYTLAVDVPEAGALEAAERTLFALAGEAATREWTAEEMTRARRQVLTGWASDLDEKAGRAHQLAFFEVSGGYAHLLEMPARLEGVTVDDVQRFARERLARDQATVGWFVPAPHAVAAASPAAQSRPTPSSRPAAPDAGTTAATPIAAAAPVDVRLANGLAVTLAAGPGTLVSLRGRIEAGSFFDPLSGTSALLTELLARPMPGEPSPIAPLVFTLHEDPDEPSAQRFIEFGASVLPDDVPDLLRDVAARLRRVAAFAGGAAIPDHEWQDVRRSAAHRARTNEQVTSTALWKSGLSELYAADGLRREPAWGRPAVVETMTQQVLRGFAQRHVNAATIRLVLAGALDVPRVRAAVEQRLAVSLPSATPRPSMKEAASPRGGAQWAEKRLPQPGKSQDDLRVVWPGDRTKPWDIAATDLILYLLGETGYAGRLGDALVDSGLVYSVYATREEVDGLPGFLMIRTASAPKDTPEVLRRIRARLDEAGRGTFTAAELAEAQAYVRGKRARAREGSAAAARDVLERSTAARPMETAAVTLDQLNDTARRLFRAGAPVALVAGPPAS